MPLELSILYRGDLSSCNYDCSYCPFAKHWESEEVLHADREGLARFTRWIAGRSDDRLAVFFTPWGEALVRAWYRKAVVELSWLPQVRKVAVQTNLSCSLDWLRRADTAKVGLWCTFHPTQTSLEVFLEKCQQLHALGVHYSVGCVGKREHLEECEEMRRRLPADVYLWVNAYKEDANYYDAALAEALTAVDPLFPINRQNHASRGQRCRTGESVITVDGRGDIRRCHFVRAVLGNLYQPGFERALFPRPCPNATCDCHIGYVHLERLQLDRVFGERILERIPAGYR